MSNINLGFFKKVHAIIHPGEVNNMRSFGSLNPDVLVTHTDSEGVVRVGREKTTREVV